MLDTISSAGDQPRQSQKTAAPEPSDAHNETPPQGVLVIRSLCPVENNVALARCFILPDDFDAAGEAVYLCDGYEPEVFSRRDRNLTFEFRDLRPGERAIESAYAVERFIARELPFSPFEGIEHARIVAYLRRQDPWDEATRLDVAEILVSLGEDGRDKLFIPWATQAEDFTVEEGNTIWAESGIDFHGLVRIAEGIIHP